MWVQQIRFMFNMFISCLGMFAVLLSSGRSLSQDRSSPSPWTDLLAQPHKHKELANYCSLLQEHYHQSYVKGYLPLHLPPPTYTQKKICLPKNY